MASLPPTKLPPIYAMQTKVIGNQNTPTENPVRQNIRSTLPEPGKFRIVPFPKAIIIATGSSDSNATKEHFFTWRTKMKRLISVQH